MITARFSYCKNYSNSPQQEKPIIQQKLKNKTTNNATKRTKLFSNIAFYIHDYSTVLGI